MKGFSNYLRPAAALLILVSALALMVPTPSPGQAAGSAPVRVVNLPLPVNVDNTPTVTLVPGQLAQLKLDMCFNGGQDVIPPTGVAAVGGFFDVPTGNRLVIEHASAIARLPIGQKLTLSINIFTPPTTFVFQHFLTPTLLGTFGADGDFFAAGGPVRMYAD